MVVTVIEGLIGIEFVGISEGRLLNGGVDEDGDDDGVGVGTVRRVCTLK